MASKMSRYFLELSERLGEDIEELENLRNFPMQTIKKETK